ncbi:MAG: hypothetical protein Ct9H300mP1_12490 [Planctomycetaceae bacterium]|nr:MAG: hypothetical protein Ct9H300mP1_12490 [Planctomycetaceae bacterium]
MGRRTRNRSTRSLPPGGSPRHPGNVSGGRGVASGGPETAKRLSAEHCFRHGDVEVGGVIRVTRRLPGTNHGARLTGRETGQSGAWWCRDCPATEVCRGPGVHRFGPLQDRSSRHRGDRWQRHDRYGQHAGGRNGGFDARLSSVDRWTFTSGRRLMRVSGFIFPRVPVTEQHFGEIQRYLDHKWQNDDDFSLFDDNCSQNVVMS